ncbi:metalloregulator ArsR/SmtB family transcription factor [Fictibacillus iocasae]|uniref:Metalloregulator ArsR/SmtB family transcription factor n=1 Tax=Fictibacillus iocasae TaxID=2715437 RepID=A0ABW2NM24_9BACL
MNLNKWLQKSVKVTYSPFRELICSLHVLSYPDHHTARLDWSRNMLQAMSPRLKEQLQRWGENSNQWFYLLDYVDVVQLEESFVEEAIDQLRYVNTDDFRNCMLGAKIEDPLETLTDLEQSIMTDAERLQKELSDLLFEYHQHHFSRELYRIEPWLIKAKHELLADMEAGSLSALQSIHPRFELNEKELVFYKSQTWRFPYSELNSITIYPSTFIAPHLLVGIDSPDIAVYQHVDIPGIVEQTLGVPEDLLRMTKALADKNRLQLLQMLLYHPYCTQQLEDITGLAKATISKHLKILSEARFVYTERRGHYVFYHINKHQIEMIKVDLDQFFDQPMMVKKGDY